MSESRDVLPSSRGIPVPEQEEVDSIDATSRVGATAVSVGAVCALMIALLMGGLYWLEQEDRRESLLELKFKARKYATPGSLLHFNLKVLDRDSGILKELNGPLEFKWMVSKDGSEQLGKIRTSSYWKKDGTPQTQHWIHLPQEVDKRLRYLWLQVTLRSGWFSSYRRRFRVLLERAQEPPVILVTLSKPIYQPGEMVRVRIQARSGLTGKPTGELKGSIQWDWPTKDNDTSYQHSHVYPVHLSKVGIGQARFLLPAKAPLGTYKLKVLFGEREVTGSFLVSRYTLPAFQVKILADTLKSKGPVTGVIQAKYLYGNPVAFGRLRLTLETLGVRLKKKGRLDREGQYSFRLKPKRLKDVLILTVRVRDQVGRVEEARVVLQPPSEKPKVDQKKKPTLKFSLLTAEGGFIARDILTKVYLQVSPPKALSGQLRCDKKTSELRCKADGYCQSEVFLSQLYLQRKYCEVSWGQGQRASLPIARLLPNQRYGPEVWSARIRPDRRYYREGERITGSILLSGKWKKKTSRPLPKRLWMSAVDARLDEASYRRLERKRGMLSGPSILELLGGVRGSSSSWNGSLNGGSVSLLGLGVGAVKKRRKQDLQKDNNWELSRLERQWSRKWLYAKPKYIAEGKIQRKAGKIYVDSIQGPGQQKIYRLRFSLPSPQGHRGLFWLSVGAKGWKRILPARVVVVKNESIQLSMKTDKPSYRPGADARLDILAKGKDGKGRAAYLGLEAVDARVLAIRGIEDAFVKWAYPFIDDVLTPQQAKAEPLLSVMLRRGIQSETLDKTMFAKTDRTLGIALGLSSEAKAAVGVLSKSPYDSGVSNVSYEYYRSAAEGSYPLALSDDVWGGLPWLLSGVGFLALLMLLYVRKGMREIARLPERLDELDPSTPGEETPVMPLVLRDGESVIPFKWRMDFSGSRLFFGLLTISLLVHFALWLKIEYTGPQLETQLQDLPQRFTRLITHSPQRSQSSYLHYFSGKQRISSQEWKKKNQKQKLKKVRSSAGFLAFIGTPSTKEELAKLLAEEKKAKKKTSKSSKTGGAVSTEDWRGGQSSSRKKRRKRGLESNEKDGKSGKVARSRVRVKKRAAKRMLSRGSRGVNLEKARARTAKRLARSGILALLGSKSSDGSGSADLLKGGGFDGGNLDEALKNVEGVALSGSLGGVRGSRRGSGSSSSSNTILSSKAALLGKTPSKAKFRRPKRRRRTRQHFPELLFWKPELILPPSGKKQIRFKVADSITTWRMRLYGLTKSGQPIRQFLNLQVFQPFFIDFQPPKILGQGDEVKVPIILTSYHKKPLKIKLRLVLGNTFVTSDISKKEIILKPKEVRAIPVTFLGKKIGSTSLYVRAEGGDEFDAVKREIQVRPAGFEVKRTWSGVLDGRKKHSIYIPKEVRPGVVKLTVRVRHLLGEIMDSVRGLIRRPYGCFEQSTSSTIPNVMALQLLKKGRKGHTKLAKRARKYLVQGYLRMRSYEVKGGGFSLYGRSPASPWLTAYGLRGFREIQRVYKSDRGLLERTTRWLMRKNGSFRSGYRARLSSTVYISRILQMLGKKEAAQRAFRWYQNRVLKKKDPYLFALALSVWPKEKQAVLIESIRELLIKEEQRSKSRRRRWVLGGLTTISGSWGRPRRLLVKALMLQTMAQLSLSKEQNKWKWKWYRELMSARYPGGGWSTTELSMEAIRAMIMINQENKSEPVVLPVKEESKDNAILAVKKLPVHIVKEGEFVLTKQVQKMLSKGSRRFQVKILPKKSLPKGSFYQVDLSYYLPSLPRASSNSFLALRVKAHRKALRVGESMKLSVSVKNRSPQKIASPMVELGIPPGMSPDQLSVDALSKTQKAIRRIRKSYRKRSKRRISRKSPVLRREVKDGRLILYLKNLKKRGTHRFEVTFAARFPARAFSGIQRAYPYYNPEYTVQLPSYKVKIQ